MCEHRVIAAEAQLFHDAAIRALWPGGVVTFSNALAATQRQVWIAQAFSSSQHAQNTTAILRALLERLTGAACHPA